MLIWPPREPGGYSPIVDGDGALEGEGTRVRVEGCSADCKPLLR